MGVQAKYGVVIQHFLDGGLFDGLPRTFSTYLFEQLQNWEMLFPAERGYFERLAGLLDRSPRESVDRLFAPLRAVEQRMGVTDRTWPPRQFSLAQVDFLQRSPNYAEWRQAIAGIFAQVDPLLEAEIERKGRPRLMLVCSPSELPASTERMWTRIKSKGRLVKLAIDDDDDVDDYLPRLLTGGARAAKRTSLLDLHAAAAQQDESRRYDGWLIEAALELAPLVDRRSGIAISYASLEQYRSKLMAEVRQLLETKDIRGPQQLGRELKLLKADAGASLFGGEPLMAEFVRSVLLAGNGTLLINNTFVEWATVQALRRARPTVMVASFGVRNKVKPFSSLLIYSDQQQSNPIPDQLDVLGSMVDLEVFYQYLWQECEKYAEYRRNTAYLYVGEGLDEMLVIAPPDFPLFAEQAPVKLEQVHEHAKTWLQL